ncbi:hypothetical protein [Aquibacillus saliphilus]|nr:hypothetical protein [Aquibacillus saliphilus]
MESTIIEAIKLSAEERQMIVSGLSKLHDSEISLYTNEEIRKLIDKLLK